MNRSGEFLFRFRMTHRTLQNEVKEQWIVVVDFVERSPLVSSDKTAARERSSPNQRIDRRQRVVAAVDQAGMQILTLEKRLEGHRHAIELQHGGDFAEQQPAVFRLIHKA